MYRDQLQADEQTTLDAYLKELSRYRLRPPVRRRPPPATAGCPAAPRGREPRPAACRRWHRPPRPSFRPAMPVRGGAGAVGVAADAKQQAQWLLHETREQMALGNFDAAEKKLAQAEAMDVKWGLFDETPGQGSRRAEQGATQDGRDGRQGRHRHSLAITRPPRPSSARLGPPCPITSTSRRKSIAQEVKGWNLSYGLFEDNPDKVAAAARALRKRDRIRNTTPREQPARGSTMSWFRNHAS